MSNSTYQSVSHEHQGMFNNPRQKMWGVFHQRAGYGWTPEIFTPLYEEAKNKVREILHDSGQNCGIDDIVLCEVVPIDTVLVPQRRF